ncbi:hypothetical protein AB6A40_002553 [Gnathostoma spinigerum]|uniref:LITAF domain-containing protein n=1 Tax=Gnathostoma spinigerum TaxID=75299 RepID=A0ABD6EER1_9BILA
MSLTPPPPYTPPRPPPPYILENSLVEKGKIVEQSATDSYNPFLSNGSSSTNVRPNIISHNVCASASDTEPNTTTKRRIKKAETAEPHEDFCPNCQCRIRTRQRFVTGKLTWSLVIIILFVCLPLAFLPFCIDSCKDVQHYCPKCNQKCGVLEETGGYYFPGYSLFRPNIHFVCFRWTFEK